MKIKKVWKKFPIAVNLFQEDFSLQCFPVQTRFNPIWLLASDYSGMIVMI